MDVFKQVMAAEMAKHGGGADADATDDTATGGEKKGGVAARQSPLSNFHMIVPALTVNFVETIRASKDRMVKTARGKEAYFTDDGFSLGVAYILAILRLTDQFKALHWFEHVHARFNREAAAVHGDVEKTRAALAELQAKKGRFRKMGKKERAAVGA